MSDKALKNSPRQDPQDMRICNAKSGFECDGSSSCAGCNFLKTVEDTDRDVINHAFRDMREIASARRIRLNESRKREAALWGALINISAEANAERMIIATTLRQSKKATLKTLSRIQRIADQALDALEACDITKGPSA